MRDNANFKLVAFPILAVLSLLIASCAGKQVDENDPEALFKDAEEEIKSDHYQVAIDKLRAIKNKFPYSHVSTDAHLRIADVYFLQESFIEAASTYESFKDLHPKHDKASYAMLRTGKSYLNDLPSTVARDLTSAHRALDAYNDFLKRFPSATEAEEARKDVATLREQLAQKELYIADFYYKRDFFDSAKPRYSKIIDLYPETLSAKEANGKLAKIQSLEGAAREGAAKEKRN